jgi:L-threonylcarbamoyladenylate synthase
MSGQTVARARILAPTAENITWAAESLKRGEIGGMPTETVYGLAGNGLDPSALARIFDAKERPRFDPLILHIPESWLSSSMLSALQDHGLVDANRLPAPARLSIEKIMARFWPGPLTLVLPKLPSVPDLATSGLPSVALRMPRHQFAQALLEAAGIPLAAPSANRFGRISPTRARHVIEELGERIGWVLDGGACEIGVESTVLACGENGDFRLLRPGGLPASEIEAVLGAPLSTAPIARSDTPDSVGMAAPGMLDSHYAPSKALTLLSSPLEQFQGQFNDEQLGAELRAALQHAPGEAPIGLLAFTGDPQALSSRFLRLTGRSTVVRVLARDGSLIDAARNLFAELRALDASSAEVLFAEPAPSLEGLGYAIQDRLTRASAKRGR